MQVRQRGFTLVEIIIALAIGGLIAGMAFLWLNQAGVQRRDNQRRADVSRLLTMARQYANDHNGRYPASTAELTAMVNDYILAGGATFNDPSTGVLYGLAGDVPLADPLTTPNTIVASHNAVCNDITPSKIMIWTSGFGGGTIALTGRNFAAAILLENGGVHCEQLG